MRRTAAVTAFVLAAISILLLVAAARCTQSNAVHLPAAGVPRCHRHLPLDHLPLWQLVTTALLPLGLVLALWPWQKRLRTPGPAHTADTASITPRPAQPTAPPNYLARELASGIAGGHVIFGERRSRGSMVRFIPLTLCMNLATTRQNLALARRAPTPSSGRWWA